MTDMALMQHILIALGIGLLIGAERERRKAVRPAAAGLRSFTMAALLGCAAAMMPQAAMVAVVVVCMTLLAVFSVWLRRDSADRGMTTEITLVATALFGALSVEAPLAAGSLAVMTTIVLAARDPLHRFVGQTISADELADGLLIAGATLIVLPMLPDRQMGPFDALNPHAMWLVVIMILAINAAGQVATRILGAQLGVPMLGLCSGFVSSSATIGAMGGWVRANPASLSAACGAAVLSTFATYAQMAVVIEMTDHRAFLATAASIAAAALTALVVGAWFTLAAWREAPAQPPHFSRSFNLAMALVFATMLSGMLVAVAALRAWFGEMGLMTAAAIGGLLDVHAAAISVAAQVGEGRIAPMQAVAPLLAACATSTGAKMLFSATAGTRRFALRVVPAQALMLVMACVVAWAGGQ